jgi:hypothetical protein
MGAAVSNGPFGTKMMREAPVRDSDFVELGNPTDANELLVALF